MIGRFLFRMTVVLFTGLPMFCPAQNTDSAQRKNNEREQRDSARSQRDTVRVEDLLQNISTNKVTRKLTSTIVRRRREDPKAAEKSEDIFMPYRGKVIRKIAIRQVDFEKQINDTTRSVRNTLVKLANAVHSNSKEWLIRDHLFFQENRSVNPYKLADNERYLRDLDFILDARIFILPLESTEDSVDVLVLTRDVFSIGGGFSPSSPTRTLFRLYDVNLFGWGQRVQLNGLLDNDRTPRYGYEMYYRKNSIGGSLVNGTFGYTQINTGSSYGDEDEKAYYIKLERPLVSPYKRFAGGLEVSRNWSGNFYGVNDTLFRKYRYLVNDIWIGYNLDANSDITNRNRRFLALRAFEQHFTLRPGQDYEQLNPVYNNQKFILGGITFFRQDFYTARYIYGFGRTEDVPYGYNLSLYAGMAKQLNLDRPYMGVDFTRSYVNDRGQFHNVGIRAGAFQNEKLEDASVLVSTSFTSGLMSYKKLLIRSTIGGDITYVHNQRTSLPLDINDTYGLQGFRADSLWGTKRLHINNENIIFTPLQLLGFKFAPFTFGELAWIAPENKTLFEYKPFFGLGGGIRTRNENLVFGTIELKVIYYPRTTQDVNQLMIRLSSNLRVKYSASFIKPPSFVTYN